MSEGSMKMERSISESGGNTRLSSLLIASMALSVSNSDEIETKIILVISNNHYPLING